MAKMKIKEPSQKFYDELKPLIRNELGYLPEGNGIDLLLSRGEVLECGSGYRLVEMGRICPDVHILKEGVVRYSDFSDGKERTFAFALPGTIFMSQHSFVKNLPSYYQVDCCCRCTILRIPRAEFWQALEESQSLAIWMVHYAYGELFSREHKNADIYNGDARERYLNLLKARPQILEKVSQRYIASYLGVSPEYFSKIKKSYLTRAEGESDNV